MMQLPWEGCNVSICVLIQKDEINSMGPCRAKAINRLVPAQTVNYETGERINEDGNFFIDRDKEEYINEKVNMIREVIN